MSLSTVDLAKARETANTILQELRLDAYVYEVEPDNGNWELKVECACDINGGWETIILKVPRQMLLDSFDNETARHELFAYWKKKLGGCKLQKT